MKNDNWKMENENTSKSLSGRSHCRASAIVPIVSLILQLDRQFLAAGFDYPASVEHVDEMRLDVIEKPLIVRDEDYGVVFFGQLIDAARDDPQRVDVQSGIGLVQHGQLRLEHGHLQNLVALLLAAGEAFVDRAVDEARVHLDYLQLLADQVVEFQRVKLVSPLELRLFVVGHAQEVGVAHAGTLDRVLKGHEDPEP